MDVQNKNFFVLLFLVFFVSLIIFPVFSVVQAQTSPDLKLQEEMRLQTQKANDEFAKAQSNVTKLHKLKYINAADIIALAIQGLMMFMGAIMFVLVVYAGFIWMTAQGNAEKIDQAKNIIVWATLGVGIILVSYIVVNYLFVLFQPTDPNAVTQSAENVEVVNSIKDAGTKVLKSCAELHPNVRTGCFGHTNEATNCPTDYPNADLSADCSGGQGTCCFDPGITWAPNATVRCSDKPFEGTCEFNCGSSKRTVSDTDCDSQGQVCCYGNSYDITPVNPLGCCMHLGVTSCENSTLYVNCNGSTDVWVNKSCNFQECVSIDGRYATPCAQLKGTCYASSDTCGTNRTLDGDCGPGQICCSKP